MSSSPLRRRAPRALALGAALAACAAPISSASAATPQLVKDINPGASSSSLSSPVVLNGFSYFTADDGVHGAELWKSDGTATGTTLVKDIFAGSPGANPYSLVATSSKVFFLAYDDTNGTELWQTDGTEAGTKLTVTGGLYPGSTDGADVIFPDTQNDSVFFEGNTPSDGQTLWTTDGTEAGTHLSADVTPGSDAGRFARFGDSVFFAADDGTSGEELYSATRNGGTATLLKNINPAGGSYPYSMTAVGGKLYFQASNPDFSNEPFVSDGTEAGTYLLKDINTNVFDFDTGATSGSGAQDFHAAGNAVVFIANDGVNGRELWATDGTEGGTHILKDINPGSDDSAPRQLTTVGSKLYFSANDGTHGPELWVTDGTEAGTHLLKDINPGSGASDPDYLTAIGDTLYFSATDGAHGYEPWQSDGTEAGTTMIGDVYPGALGSAPQNFAKAGYTLLFDAEDATHGRELWSLALPQPPAPPVTPVAKTPAAAALSLGAPKVLSRSTKKATVKLRATVPAAGVLSAIQVTTAPSFVRAVSASALAAGPQDYTLIPTSAGYRKLRALRRAGKPAVLRVRMRLTITAADGRTATRTDDYKLTLK